MMTNTQLLAVAKKQLGNGGSKYRSYVGAGGNYCNMFVYWLYNANGCAALLPLPATKYYRTYCPDSIKWCRKNLAEIPPYLAMACDIIYMDWEPNGTPNHIGIVDHKISTAKIATVEGNTSGIKNGKSVSGIVAAKTRNTKYTNVFRPHFKGSFSLKTLKIDGDCGYNTIACLQQALKILKYYTGSVDGILGIQTVKAIQKWAGVKADGAWGTATSKAVQKKIVTKADGEFGEKSVIALQKWINANAFPSTMGQNTSSSTVTKPTTVNPKAQKAVDWGRAIAKSGKYKYKKWNNKSKNSKLCPICHPGSGNGWNCIGFVSACYKHGGGIPINCSCSGIGTDSFFTKVTLASWKKRNGNNWIMINNGGKKGGSSIPSSKLQTGDCVICYDDDGEFKHIVIYSGDGKFLESTNGKKPNIAERKYSDLIKKKHATRAFRYTG